MALLFLSELWSFLHVSTVSHMTVNSHHEAREAVVHLHITFPSIPCNALNLEVENIRVSQLLSSLATSLQLSLCCSNCD
jgi:Endoplasmic Reticulum-Golgi Intermediate Compartment (ERGIC)